jgi:hypothetical protein
VALRGLTPATDQFAGLLTLSSQWADISPPAQLTIDAAPKKIGETNTASPLTGPIAATSMGPHHRALEIAQSEAAERKSLAAIITLQKFFIDRSAVFFE